ncbi:type 1 glutamine amidotransferase [Fodinicurvata halophila]|uniref:Type 1 glutamine amidotransferase n=1 Tax=Fodinicurvata halophila TaxID=1419723 RepID=A0ABV8UMU6_9PROT
MARLRILVVDGNTPQLNDAHAALGGTRTAAHYISVLNALRDDLECDSVHPADVSVNDLPSSRQLAAYDGIAWTGSALNVYNDEPEVTRQVDLAHAAFASGTPIFGSCWGLQVAAVAAGGKVRANPLGREIGFARRIRQLVSGGEHPLLSGKDPVFDAICVHLDEVSVEPPGMTVLATNEVSRIQAAEIRHDNSTCWAVQYHPEYDFHEIATVMLRYRERMLADGFFPDIPALERFTDNLKALQADPARKDLGWLYGLNAMVLDRPTRNRELANWLEHLVLPTARERGRWPTSV